MSNHEALVEDAASASSAGDPREEDVGGDEALPSLPPRAGGRTLDLVRLAVAGVVVGGLTLFFLLGGHRHLSWVGMQSWLAPLRAASSAHPLLLALTFVLVQFLLATFFIPGGLMVSALAGAVLGIAPGLAVVLVGSGVGATTAAALSRFVLRDWLCRRFPVTLGWLETAVRRGGVPYLFFLRVAPFVPFFLVNIAGGISGMPLWRFFWVSCAGMVPMVLLWLNLGRRLAEARSPGELFEPSTLISIVAIGLFPWASKSLLRWARWRFPVQLGS